MSPPFPAITVEQLLALNDEIRALARAGVPLESGLRALGGDLPGRLGRLAERISERLERGESLVEVLEGGSDAFPPAYRAVVAAGIRSGRLPTALEAIARSVRQAAELRRTMIVAMVYPLLLGQIATGLFIFSVLHTVPVVANVYELTGIESPAWYPGLTRLASRVVPWLPWIWLAVFAGIGWWWFRSRQAAYLGTGAGGWWPTLGNVRRAGRMATFAEVMATLVDHQIPLAEAVELAAAAAGGNEMRQAGQLLSAELRRGGRGAEPPRGIPPLLAWLIVTTPNQPQLARALRHTATRYRRRAVRMSVVLGTYVPIFLSAFIGGVVALYYVLLTMAPFYYLLYQLGLP